jgi:hypothetical protein
MVRGWEGGLAPALRRATPIMKSDLTLQLNRKDAIGAGLLSRIEVINEERGQALLPNLELFRVPPMILGL